MPRPVFILCAESQSVDQATNLLSLFHVLDGFQVIRTVKPGEDPSTGDPPDSPGVAALQRLGFIGVAVWMRYDNDDLGQEYEFELVIQPPGSDERNVRKGQFKFTKTFQRFDALFAIPGPWETGGIFKFESRIRKVGDRTWQRQDYPLPIHVFVKPRDEADEVANTQNTHE